MSIKRKNEIIGIYRLYDYVCGPEKSTDEFELLGLLRV